MIKQKLLFYPRVDKIIPKLKICQVLRFVVKNVKNLNNFNTIKEGLVEVASTTCADIIEGILISVICTPIYTPK